MENTECQEVIEILIEPEKWKKLISMSNATYNGVRNLLFDNRKNSLRRYLSENVITENAFATELGVSLKNIRSWICSGTPIPSEYVSKIIQYFGITEEMLFTEMPPKEERKVRPKKEIKEKESPTNKFIETFKSLQKDGKVSLVKLADAFDVHKRTVRRWLNDIPEYHISGGIVFSDKKEEPAEVKKEIEITDAKTKHHIIRIFSKQYKNASIAEFCNKVFNGADKALVTKWFNKEIESPEYAGIFRAHFNLNSVSAKLE